MKLSENKLKKKVKNMKLKLNEEQNKTKLDWRQSVQGVH